MVKNFFKLESVNPHLMSEDDAKAVSIMNNTCQKRLMCLKKKFVKEPALKSIIQGQIDNLLAKGSTKKLTAEEIAVPREKIWYIPIFILTNPNKPAKIRMVWDAVAKVKGLSLNDFLLRGPDFLNPLVEILLSFRVGRVAICGDISEMFNRINIREGDMHSQRFLWYDEGDKQDSPSVYVMRAMTFGLNCAPCIAHYIRDKDADKFKEEYPRAVDAVKNSHYVDDYIASEDDEQSALQLAHQAQKIHSSAGFNIRGWSSNSMNVLEQLERSSSVIQTGKEWGSTTKVLGMFWDPIGDSFKYICRFSRLRCDDINEPLVPTKREVLQVLMSIFDPLGFVSCYTIGLKILLQDVWRSGITWDQRLNDDLHNKWCQWKNVMRLITAVEIPRRYSVLLKGADDVQLHT
ncbi:uncharacterized protein LOC118757227, partial [Rhagoletis pomonella]|uniref:uncharacterized protein LOC118757227 n=1 Tax=Rhagoletis pomonella TaxID=28610 RepID=UPI001785E3F7